MSKIETRRAHEGLTVKVLVIAIILVLLMVPKVTITRQAHGQEEGAWGGTGTEFGFLPISILWIVMVIMSIMPKQYAFSPAEMAVFMGIAAFSGVLVPHGILATVNSFLYPPISGWLDKEVALLPDWWLPKADVIRGAWTGMSDVPWGALMPYLVVWTIYTIAMYTIVICTISIFQRKMIYIDRLPFPNIEPGVRMVEDYKPSGSSRPILKNKSFWLGWIFGALWSGPMTINMFYPLIPREHVFGRVPLDPYFAPIFVPWHIEGWWFIDPHILPWFTLMPVDVLATMAILDFLFYWIFPVVGTLTGAMAPGVSAWSYYWGDVEAGFAPMQMQIGGSAMAGIGIWFLITSRQYIKGNLMSALKGLKQRSASGEEDIPVRTAWILLAVGWLIFLGVWVASGANIAVLIFAAILWGITLIGSVWMQSFNIQWLDNPFGGWTGHHYVWRFGESIGAYPNPSTSMAAISARAAGTAFPMANANWSGSMGVLWGYKGAERTGASPKAVFYGILISMVVCMVIGVPIVTALEFRYGKSTILTGPPWPTWHSNMPVYGACITMGTGVLAPFTHWTPFQYTWSIIGMILPIVFMVLRARFPWFFLHPAGLMLWPICYGIFNSVPGLILKLAILKIGGAKFYSETWVRIVAGFITGMVTLAFVAMWTLAIKTF